MAHRRYINRSICTFKRLLNVRPAHILEKVVSMQHSFKEILEKQRRVELKSIGNFVAKTVLVETVFQIEIKLYRTVGLSLVKSIGHFGLSSQKI